MYKAAGIAMALALGVAGCAQREGVSFSASATQTPIVRDGRPSIVSKKKGSLVLVSPASREFSQSERPIYALAVNNLTNQPVDMRISNIQVSQRMPGGTLAALQVIPYEQLMSEERTRQVVGAILVGAAAAANSYSASRAGYGTYSGRAYGPGGSVSYGGTYYSPTAAAIANTNASIQNEAMIAQTVATGQANMASLERGVLKDNTVMPGEWIGGRVYFSPPVTVAGHPKQYTISITVGGETHEIDVTQTPQASS